MPRLPVLGTGDRIAGKHLPPADTLRALSLVDRTDNTGDLEKPMSSATEAALDTRANRARTRRVVTGNYTLTSADGAEDVSLHVTATTAVAITLPPDVTAVIPQEYVIPWRQFGAGQITFVAAADVTLVAEESAFSSSMRYSQGTLTKVGPNTWLLAGDIVVGAGPPPVTQDEPGAVASATATAGDTQITLSWTPPLSDGGSPITGYRVTRNLPDWTATYPATQRSIVLTNFTNGTAYTVTVTAVNAIGPGPVTTRTATPTGGGTGPVTGSGFSDRILAVAGLTHYYPMNDTYALQDLAGDRPLTNAGGGVSFTPSGAVFEGVAADYLTAESDPDFSVRNPTNAVSFLLCVTFPTYTQPSQFHWLGKGGNLSNNYEWALRLYGGTGGTGRARGISNYYWNPNPSTDINGNAVDNRKGSGAYLAPPTAAPDYGGGERQNGPVGSGTIGKEHILGIEFTYAANYAGRCRLYYGSNTAPMALLSDRRMDADALITPQYGNGKLYIGKRGDSDGMVKATMRRLAFFNRSLSLSEWASFRTNMSLAEG